MENKIYEKLKEKQKRCSEHYLKMTGIEMDYDDLIPAKNLDLLIILKELELVSEDCDKLDEINEFYEYLFKVGIDTGIGLGKKLAITSIKNKELTFEELMEIDPEKLVNYDLEPTFITDLKEAILNEK